MPHSRTAGAAIRGPRCGSQKRLELRDTYLPRRYQTANVIDAIGGFYKGAAWLIRSKNGLEGRIMTNVPTSGDAYTLWVIVFNNPEECEGPCDDPDVENPATQASVFNGTGAISADNGKGGGVVNLDFKVVAGNLPNDLFILAGDGDGLRRNNGFDAQVVLIIDQHPEVPSGASWIGDLTTTNFPMMGPATNDAVAVFLPCRETPARHLRSRPAGSAGDQNLSGFRLLSLPDEVYCRDPDALAENWSQVALPLSWSSSSSISMSSSAA